MILKKLVNGVFRQESRLYDMFGKLKNRGCDGPVLGRTEIPFLVDPAECPLPTLDSTRLLAWAGLKEALA